MLESKDCMPARMSAVPVDHPLQASQPVPSTKVGFVSLGCPKNLVDSEVMMGLVARAGAD